MTENGTEQKEIDKKELVHPAHKLLQRIKNPNSLHIGKLPPATKAKFIALADSDEFGSDYGMCLKFLIDDLISPDTKLMLDQISNLNERMIKLEQQETIVAEPEQKEQRRMCDGKMRNKK